MTDARRAGVRTTNPGRADACCDAAAAVGRGEARKDCCCCDPRILGDTKGAELRLPAVALAEAALDTGTPPDAAAAAASSFDTPAESLLPPRIEDATLSCPTAAEGVEEEEGEEEGRLRGGTTTPLAEVMLARRGRSRAPSPADKSGTTRLGRCDGVEDEGC